MKGWPDVFGTRSREEVSQELKDQEQVFTWKENGNLQILNKVEAVEKHPVTGDSIWFNHLMVISRTLIRNSSQPLLCSGRNQLYNLEYS